MTQILIGTKFLVDIAQYLNVELDKKSSANDVIQAIKKQLQEPQTVTIDVEAFLAKVREDNPKLYMRGVTSDMLIKYT